MNRSPGSSSSTAPAPRSASVSKGRGSESTASAVGWNCMNSRSARRTPQRAAAARPAPREVRGIGRAVEACADAAGREHRRVARAPRAGDPSGHSSSTPPARLPHSDEVDEFEAFEHADVGALDRRLPHRAHDCGAGAIAAGVDDAMPAVPRFAAERRRAGVRAGRIQRRAGAASRCVPAAAAVTSAAISGSARPAATRRVSAACRAGESFAIERSGDAALRETRGAAADRFVGDQHASAQGQVPSRGRRCRRRRRRPGR